MPAPARIPAGLGGLAAGFVAVLLAASVPAAAEARSVYDFSMEDIDGNPVPLSRYAGKVVLIVNVASRCGYTYQYEALEALYRRYEDRGLVVLGVPANDFLGQEPGTNEQIKEFCTATYGVTFPMFSRISVKGRGIHPLYSWLTSRSTNPAFAGAITWNFNKFLVGRDGRVVARFRTQDEPGSAAVVAAVDAALK
jgi:glutathione peroxidase